MTRTDVRDLVYQSVDQERARQTELWADVHPWGRGDCSSPDVEDTTKLAVLSEEVGEVAHALLTFDGDELRRELVQVAAVAVAWLEELT